jgi:hypothetical protein
MGNWYYKRVMAQAQCINGHPIYFVARDWKTVRCRYCNNKIKGLITFSGKEKHLQIINKEQPEVTPQAVPSLVSIPTFKYSQSPLDKQPRHTLILASKNTVSLDT